ncbi:MAG: right-handed parallel beta-helix repeat-containing protein [Clostridia bacterium]|nr:right-handed parallel beta-helix repeat-containing protein [Clostridia bacterium]
MKRFTGIILILALIFTSLPIGVLADNYSFCAYFTDFVNRNSDAAAITFTGTNEYGYDAVNDLFIGDYLQYNSMALGDTNYSKATFAFPAVTVEEANMYAVLQFDFRMEDMVNDNKNLYLNFPVNNALNLTPNGRLNAGTEYNLKTLIGWTKTDWTRIQLVYTLTDENGDSHVTLSKVLVNGKELSDFTSVAYDVTLSEIKDIKMHLSAHKTTDSDPVLYNADIDNVGLYITTGTTPVFADKTTLKETIIKYNDYISVMEPGASEADINSVMDTLYAGADVVNNTLATDRQIADAIANIEDTYAELFFGDNYSERRDYMYTRYLTLTSIVDEYDSGADSLYTSEEIENMRTICQGISAVYADELAPLYVIEKQIALSEHVIVTDAYSVTGITVTDAEGYELSDFVPGGLLTKITLLKRNPDVFDGVIYITFYDGNDNLTNVYSKAVEFTAESGEIQVDLTDENIILPSDVRMGSVGVMLWDSNLAPLMKKYIREGLNDWEVYYNSNLILPDAMPVYYSAGNIHVGVKYLLNLMGINLEVYGDRCYAKRDSDEAYIEFTIGSQTVNSSKGTIDLGAPAYLINDCAAMLPMNVLTEVFGCELESVDGFNGRLYITYDDDAYAQSYGKLPNEYKASYTSDIYSASYKLIVPDGVTQVEVWYKSTYTQPDSAFNVDTFNSRMDSRYWRKAPDPVKTDDKTYTGSLSYLNANTQYNMKYVVTKDGVKNTYVTIAPVKTLTQSAAKEHILYSADSLTLVPTYENISYYIDYDVAEDCEVSYRKSTDTEWRKAYEPFNDTVEKQFRGSIVKLEDNTEYEVRAVLTDAEGNEVAEHIESVTTWNDSPVITTVSLADYIGVYDTAGTTITEPIQLVGIEGTEDNWIKIDCSGYTVEAGYNSVSAVSIDSCKYVIVDGLTVKGGYRCGIAVNGSCSDVRVSDCDISGFGRTGIQRENGWYYRDGTPINYDAGVLLLNGSNITIENCYIHDARAKTNSWRGDTWSNTHPYGSTGIYYRIADSCVIRYNDIIGNETHRWNDGIEGSGNGHYTGGPSRDTDIYGNTITYGQDDGMELDGGQMNVRVYGNKIEQFLCGASLVTNLAGPSYIYENVITNMGTESSANGKAFKAGGSQNDSVSYVFNNTCFVNGVIVENTNYNTSEYNFVTRNNIFVNNRGGSCYKNTFEGALNDNDYDFCYGWNDGYSSKGNSKIYTPAIGLTALYDKLDFADAAKGDFTLGDSSECKGAGTYIDNFCEIRNPNMGAFQ